MQLSFEQFERLHVGDVVCDMHYGISRLVLDERLEIVDHVEWFAKSGSAFIASNVGRDVSNKMAVVVSEDGRCVTLNYSYDNRRFGVFRIQRKGSR